MTASRPGGAWLVWLVVGGYLLVWTAFGFLAYLADLGVHQLVHRVALIERNEWAISAAVLFLAGIYQFTPLKYHCLEKCRSPLTFIAGRWHGRNPHRDALHLGIDHGLFCVGCCWTLMLIMFLVGAGSIFWMLLLGAIMAVEKNMPWGRRLSAPLGVSLVSVGCAISVLALT
jgi:predicted metal-binding membrane protein